MGTITIEEYGTAGAGKDHSTQIPNLKTLLKTTVDSSTSTSAESITLQDGTGIVTITAVEDHRLSYGSDLTTSAYALCGAGVSRDFGVEGGATIYYRADA